MPPMETPHCIGVPYSASMLVRETAWNQVSSNRPFGHSLYKVFTFDRGFQPLRLHLKLLVLHNAHPAGVVKARESGELNLMRLRVVEVRNQTPA